MPDSGGQNNSLKYLFACLVAIIVLLIVVTQLGLNPTEIITPPMTVKFGRLAPSPALGASDAQSQNNQRLDEELRKIKEQLRTYQQSNTTPSPPATVNIAGSWQSNTGTFTFVQYGTQIAVQLVSYGIIVSAGQGTVSGRQVNFTYLNNLYQPGSAQGAVSPDNSQIELTANPGSPLMQSFTLTRVSSQNRW